MKLNCLLYADDLVLLSESEHMQPESGKLDTKQNKVLILYKKGLFIKINCHYRIKEMECIDYYKYLCLGLSKHTSNSDAWQGIQTRQEHRSTLRAQALWMIPARQRQSPQNGNLIKRSLTKYSNALQNWSRN